MYYRDVFQKMAALKGSGPVSKLDPAMSGTTLQLLQLLGVKEWTSDELASELGLVSSDVRKRLGRLGSLVQQDHGNTGHTLSPEGRVTLASLGVEFLALIEEAVVGLEAYRSDDELEEDLEARKDAFANLLTVDVELLYELTSQPEGVTMAGLISTSRRTKVSTTARVERLAERGLVSVDSTESESVTVHLTAPGWVAMAEVFQRWSSVLPALREISGECVASVDIPNWADRVANVRASNVVMWAHVTSPPPLAALRSVIPGVVKSDFGKLSYALHRAGFGQTDESGSFAWSESGRVFVQSFLNHFEGKITELGVQLSAHDRALLTSTAPEVGGEPTFAEL